MEIRVNKSASEKAAKDFVDRTISIAKDFAERGRDIFWVDYPRGIGYSAWDFVEMVSEATNDTVYAGGISNGEIKFRIRD